MGETVYPVILSGGVGTRLWPMSRVLRPKQLLPLTSERSMLQDTVVRVTGPGFAPPMIICNQEHRFVIAEQMRALEVSPEAIVLEPQGRNTAPAVTVAALLLASKDPDAIMLVLPSDHVIGDLERFREVVATAVTAARDDALITFGIPPTRPETGYGYIRRGDAYKGISGCFRIDSFVEKPDLPTAESYVASDRYAWNSGMFILPVGSYLDEVARLKPEMLELCRQSVARATTDLDFLRLDQESFAAMESVSIDYAVMEHTTKGAIVPADMAWSDVGSWSALWEISDRDADGNVVLGDTITLDARNCYIRGDGNLVAVVGVEDLVVVATDDVVLVVPRERAQDVKQIVDRIEKEGRTEHYVHTRVFRPWGWYRSIHDGPRFQVKEIMVEPGHKLSKQVHYHRAEHWVIVSGTAKVSRNSETFFLTEDQSTYIPNNIKHSLENPGKIPLRMIEVQSGSYLGEDDIVRFEDHYGRADDGETSGSQ
jgi:mannose-1-phosphate guanylyltransferase / mannose-6-phosphate isomerase